jgi:hypothetical protein
VRIYDQNGVAALFELLIAGPAQRVFLNDQVHVSRGEMTKCAIWRAHLWPNAQFSNGVKQIAYSWWVVHRELTTNHQPFVN